MPQAIFITGGSGYIGSVLIEHAIAQGYTVRALSRREDSDEHLRSLGASPVRGDLTSHDVLTREASQADIVVNIANALSDSLTKGKIDQGTMKEPYRINIEALEVIGKALVGTGKSLVLTGGSLTVAADSEGKDTNEASPLWPDSPFGNGIEETGLPLKDQGVRVCCVRLAPYVYGRGGSGVKLFMGMGARMGEMIYVDEGAARITSVHVDDAARLYLLVAQKGRAGEIYNATSETHVTNRKLTKAMAKAIGVPTRSQTYAETEAEFGLFLAKFFSLENRASNKKAKEEFGWEPKAQNGILEEIATGSYVQVAEELRKASA